jgi:hypothetical protein
MANDLSFANQRKIYQLALTIPGMSPLLANSLKQSLDNLNFLKNPRARPVIWHRLRSLTGEELRGILLSSF